MGFVAFRALDGVHHSLVITGKCFFLYFGITVFTLHSLLMIVFVSMSLGQILTPWVFAFCHWVGFLGIGLVGVSVYLGLDPVCVFLVVDRDP